MPVRVRCVECGKERTVWDDQEMPAECRACKGELAKLPNVSVPNRKTLNWMIVACAALAVFVMREEIAGLYAKLAHVVSEFFRSGW